MERSADPISKSLNSPAPPPRAAEESPGEAPRELSFGLYLRRERILRGISREEVTRVTKVSLKYVEAIESNRLEELPPKPFVVGFLRVFSGYAGLNADEVVNRYLTELGRQEAYEERVIEEKPFWKRHIQKILGVFGAACLLLLMFAPLFRH